MARSGRVEGIFAEDNYPKRKRIYQLVMRLLIVVSLAWTEWAITLVFIY